MNNNTDYLKLKAKYENEFFKCLQPLCFAKLDETGYIKYTRQEMDFYFEHVRIEGRDGNQYVNVSFFDIWCKDPNIRVCEKLPSLQPVQPVQPVVVVQPKSTNDDDILILESDSDKKPKPTQNSNPFYTTNLFYDGDGQLECSNKKSSKKSSKKSKISKAIKDDDEVDHRDEEVEMPSIIAILMNEKD